jgi:hypothetical protein
MTFDPRLESGSSALCRFLDSGIDLTETPIEVGDGMCLHVDPSREGCILHYDRRPCCATLAHISGD